MWSFLRAKTPNPQQADAIETPIVDLDLDLDHILGRGLFEPLEPPSPKRNSPPSIEDTKVTQDKAKASKAA